MSRKVAVVYVAGVALSVCSAVMAALALSNPNGSIVVLLATVALLATQLAFFLHMRSVTRHRWRQQTAIRRLERELLKIDETLCASRAIPADTVVPGDPDYAALALLYNRIHGIERAMGMRAAAQRSDAEVLGEEAAER